MKLMLSAGFGFAVYMGLAYVRRFSAGCGGACAAEGLEGAFVISLEILVAVLIVSLGTALVQSVPSPRRNRPRLVGRDCGMEHHNEFVYAGNVHAEPRSECR